MFVKYKTMCKEHLFTRTEQDGTSLLLIKPSAHQVFLNKTGVKILDLAFNYEDTDEVLTQLSKDYPSVDTRILESDMIELFHLLDIYEIICWDFNATKLYNSFYLDNENRVLVKIAGDKDYRNVSNFIKTIGLKNSIYHCQVELPSYYDPIALRYHTFNDKEYGIFTCIDEEIHSYMSVIPPASEESMVLVITSIFLKPSLEDAVIRDLILGMLNRMMHLITGRVRKIRIGDTGKTAPEIINIFKSIGFEKECELKDEAPYGDLIMYTKFLPL